VSSDISPLAAIDRHTRLRYAKPVQVTLDISDNLAQRLESEREHLTEIIESGLRVREWVGASVLVKEVIDFLGRGPRPQEIVAFRPSAAAVERSRELLRRNKEGRLPPAEEAELEEMALLDHLVTLIKAKAWQYARPAA
jgi:hypothetical protein